MALQRAIFKYNDIEQPIIPIFNNQIANSNNYFFPCPNFSWNETDGQRLPVSTVSLDAIDEYLGTDNVAIEFQDQASGADKIFKLFVAIRSGVSLTSIFEEPVPATANHADYTAPYSVRVETIVDGLSSSVINPNQSYGQEMDYNNVPSIAYQDDTVTIWVLTGTVTARDTFMPIIDNCNQISYDYDKPWNYFVFNDTNSTETTDLKAVQYLQLTEKADRLTYALNNSMNYDETHVSWSGEHETAVDWTIYLSSEKLPYIDIVYNLPEETENFVWNGIRIISKASMTAEDAILDIDYQEGVDSYGFNYTGISNYKAYEGEYFFFVKAKYTTLDGIEHWTSTAFFAVYRGGMLSAFVNNSEDNPHYIEDPQDGSTITIKMGWKEEDEDYIQSHKDRDDTDDISDPISEEGSYNINGVGNRQYACTNTMINNLVSWLWNTGVLDNLKLWNNNPIENIVSVQVFPFEISTSSTSTIHIGNIDTEISAGVISNNYNAVFKIAEGYIEPYFNNFLDYSPYTSISLYLPFVGLKDLDPIVVVGHTIAVYYIVDLITGSCKCMVYITDTGEKQLIAEYSGQMGIEIPLNASNRAQIQKGYIESAVTMVAQIATEQYAVAGVTLLNAVSQKNHTETSGSFSPSCEAYSPRSVYVIYNRPTYQEISQFNHTHGRLCQLSLNLGSLSGFTQVSEGVDLSGIPCTPNERDMIHDLLVSGVYL